MEFYCIVFENEFLIEKSQASSEGDELLLDMNNNDYNIIHIFSIRIMMASLE